MRDESLDEFESLFEQASIPVLDIQDVALARITAVLCGDRLDETILRISAYLKARFNSDIHLHWSSMIAADAAGRLAEENQFERHTEAYTSTAELVGQIAIGRSQLLLLPLSQDKSTGLVDLDAVVQGTAPPVLIVNRPVSDPAAIFRNVLHSLTGNFRQTQNFAYSFTLAEDRGRLLLLHVVDQSEVSDVRDALCVSTEIDAASGRALLENLRHHGQRYLKAVVAASRARPFEVSYRLDVGCVVDTVRAVLAGGDFSLLVVGSHVDGHSEVSADDYQLMHQLHDIPVLAL